MYNIGSCCNEHGVKQVSVGTIFVAVVRSMA